MIQAIIYLSISFLFLFILIEFKGNTVEKLPLILVILEIGKSIVVYFDYARGYNGFIFITLASVAILNIYNFRKVKKAYIINFVIFIAFSIYLFARINISEIGYANSITRLGNTILIFFFYIVGLFFSSKISYRRLLKYYLISCAVLVTFALFSSIFRFGDSAYEGGLIYGVTQFQIYYFPLFLILYPVLKDIDTRYKTHYSSAINILSLLSLGIVVLSLMRTTWLMVIGGFIIHMVFAQSSKIKSKILIFGSICFSIAVIFVINFEILQVRESRFSDDFEISEENRIIEYVLTHEYVNDTNRELWFGTGDLFNSEGKFDLIRKDRPLHSTYAKLIYGGGYFGLFLFFLYLGSFISQYVSLSSYERSRNRYVFLSLMFILIISLFSANTTYGYGISYFTLTFLLIGLFSSKY